MRPLKVQTVVSCHEPMRMLDIRSHRLHLPSHGSRSYPRIPVRQGCLTFNTGTDDNSQSSSGDNSSQSRHQHSNPRADYWVLYHYCSNYSHRSTSFYQKLPCPSRAQSGHLEHGMWLTHHASRKEGMASGNFEVPAS